MKRKLKEVNFYQDRDSQIVAIKKGFEAAKTPVSNFNLLNEF